MAISSPHHQRDVARVNFPRGGTPATTWDAHVNRSLCSSAVEPRARGAGRVWHAESGLEIQLELRGSQSRVRTEPGFASDPPTRSFVSRVKPAGLCKTLCQGHCQSSTRAPALIKGRREFPKPLQRVTLRCSRPYKPVPFQPTPYLFPLARAQPLRQFSTHIC